MLIVCYFLSLILMLIFIESFLNAWVEGFIYVCVFFW